MRLLLLLLCLSAQTYTLGQYAINEIPKNLKKNANAVIRENQIIITLDEFDDMTIYQKEVITVLNRSGLSSVNPVVGYNNSRFVKKLEARVYNKAGKVIKKFKKRDFKEASATGSDLYNDDRKMFLDYSVRSFPFTLEFISEIKTSSTAFLPRWQPISNYNVSSQKASYTLINENEVPLITRKYNLENSNITMEEEPQKLYYELINMPAVEYEAKGPNYTEFVPIVKIALQKFSLEKQNAFVKNWKEFGLWQKDKLLYGRDEISEETKAKIDKLVAGIDDPKMKAQLIYEYMQNKTRYISVQVGIGGWQPPPAKEVDELSYGDCKGLANYTKALLKTQGIDSYYTIVNAGKNGLDLDEDFVALQGNHVMLTVPFENENVFLECTSQEAPFNYLGNFTDDRKVLMITPDGGVMTKTHIYKTKDNIQILNAKVSLGNDNIVKGKVIQTSQGVKYGNKYFLISSENNDIKMYYKEMWGHLNNLSMENISFNNDKGNVIFTEKLNFETDNYSATAGERILLNPNIFNRFDYLQSLEKNRTLPLVLKRGSTYNDNIDFLLPEGFTIEAVFEPITIVSKFGSYTASIKSSNGKKIIYNRELVLNSGTFPKEDYNEYVAFIQEVVKKDKSKIVLSKK